MARPIVSSAEKRPPLATRADDVIGVEDLDLVAGLDVAGLDLARAVLLDAHDVRRAARGRGRRLP